MRYVLSESTAYKIGNLLNGSVTLSTGGTPPRQVRASAAPAPFTLQHSASASGGNAAAWIIYLTADSLIYAGSTIDLRSGLTAATGYPSGWYIVPSSALPASGGTLYLVIDTSSAAATASFAAAASSATAAVNFVVATATYSSSTHLASIVPNLVGALAYGGGGGGGAVPIAGSDNDCFSIRYTNEGTEEAPVYVPTSMVNCYYSRGAVCLDLGTQTWSDYWNDAAIALKVVPLGSDTIVYYPTIAAMLADTSNENYIIRPLYYMQGGAVSVDFRKMPSAQMTEVLV